MKNFQFSVFNFQKQRGFALLISVIFMSVMLSFGLALGSLAYKQQVLASSAVASQYAFYAADAALECALYYDQRENLFAYEAYDGSAKGMTCDGVVASVAQTQTGTPQQVISTARISLDTATSRPRCADVTVYKPPVGEGTTYLFSQGYDVSCATVASPGDARFVARGLDARY